jgi:hypothetical protein
MRRAAALAVLLGAGFLAGHAFADGVPLPPVPSITSVTSITSIVSVTSSLPSLPTTPSVTSPPSLPATTVQTATTALPLATTSAPPNRGPSSPGGVTSATTATRGASGSSAEPGTSFAGGPASPLGASATGAGDPSGGQEVTRGHTSRTWISATGPKGRRTTVLRFVLPRASRLVFVVEQLAPVCRVVGRFAVAGHAGVNRVRFPRPKSRQKLKLDSGTYRISGRTGSGRLVERVVLVVFEHGPPTARELATARSANVCPPPTSLAPLGGGSIYAQLTSPSLTPGRPAANGPVLNKSGSPPGGVLGSTAVKAARAIRPVLVALLGVAILLLGIASLPELAFVDRRANRLLARHRLEIMALGAAAFIAVVITFLIR